MMSRVKSLINSEKLSILFNSSFLLNWFKFYLFIQLNVFIQFNSTQLNFHVHSSAFLSLAIYERIHDVQLLLELGSVKRYVIVCNLSKQTVFRTLFSKMLQNIARQTGMYNLYILLFIFGLFL